MAKLNLKCTFSIAANKELRENRLFTGRMDDEGNISFMLYNSAENKRKRIFLSVGISGELFISHNGTVVAKFISIKTKTLLCKFVDHGNPSKKTFSVGTRYQVEDGRALGSVAGYVFDKDGDRWTLYREEVGFSAGGVALFEAKYS